MRKRLADAKLVLLMLQAPTVAPSTGKEMPREGYESMPSYCVVLTRTAYPRTYVNPERELVTTSLVTIQSLTSREVAQTPVPIAAIHVSSLPQSSSCLVLLREAVAKARLKASRLEPEWLRIQEQADDIVQAR